MPGGWGGLVFGSGPGRVGWQVALVAPPMGMRSSKIYLVQKGGSTRPQCRLPAADRASDREITGDGEGEENHQRHEVDTRVTIGPPADNPEKFQRFT